VRPVDAGVWWGVGGAWVRAPPLVGEEGSREGGDVRSHAPSPNPSRLLTPVLKSQLPTSNSRIPTPARRYRDSLAFDGGITNFIPVPPGPAGTQPVRVCCFPAARMGASFGPIGIAPDAFEAFPHTMQGAEKGGVVW
jgi:hypothetical protein